MTKFKFSHFFRPKKWQSPNFQAVSELFHSEFRTLFGISCYAGHLQIILHLNKITECLKMTTFKIVFSFDVFFSDETTCTAR